MDGRGNPKYSGIPGNPSAGNQALKLLGMECYSMFIDRMEIGEAGAFARLTDDELARRIATDAAVLGLNPEAAESFLAKFEGVKH